MHVRINVPLDAKQNVTSTVLPTVHTPVLLTVLAIALRSVAVVQIFATPVSECVLGFVLSSARLPVPIVRTTAAGGVTTPVTVSVSLTAIIVVSPIALVVALPS